MSVSEKVNRVLAERQEDYGNAEDNFATIGRIWGALLDRSDIPSYQVALMMDALKSVRCFNNPKHEDSWIDKLGYIHLGKEIINGSK